MSTVALVKKRNKYIAVRYIFNKEKIDEGGIEVEYTRTLQMLVAVFIKHYKEKSLGPCVPRYLSAMWSTVLEMWSSETLKHLGSVFSLSDFKGYNYR